MRQLAGNAFAIAMLGLLEAVAMAKAIASRTGQQLDINQQCLSEGAANLAGSFFQCFPGSGSLTRSAVNQQAGAVTPVVGGVLRRRGRRRRCCCSRRWPSSFRGPRSPGLLMLAAFRMVDREQLALSSAGHSL